MSNLRSSAHLWNSPRYRRRLWDWEDDCSWICSERSQGVYCSSKGGPIKRGAPIVSIALILEDDTIWFQAVADLNKAAPIPVQYIPANVAVRTSLLGTRLNPHDAMVCKVSSRMRRSHQGVQKARKQAPCSCKQLRNYMGRPIP